MSGYTKGGELFTPTAHTPVKNTRFSRVCLNFYEDILDSGFCMRVKVYEDVYVYGGEGVL